MSNSSVILRSATLEDVESIHTLISAHVGENRLLPRTPLAIRRSIEGWIVAEAESDEKIVGCGTLASFARGLSEVRSLVVDTAYQSNGLGSKIVSALLDSAAERNVKTVFTLTTAVAFFERQGFVPTSRRNFPLKIYRDCLRCPVKFRCDEVAMVYRNHGSKQ